MAQHLNFIYIILWINSSPAYSPQISLCEYILVTKLGVTVKGWLEACFKWQWKLLESQLFRWHTKVGELKGDYIKKWNGVL